MFDIPLEDLELLAKAIDPRDLKAFIMHSKTMNDKATKMPERIKAAEAVFKLSMAHSKNNPKDKALKHLAAEMPDIPDFEAEQAIAPVQPVEGAAPVPPVVGAAPAASIPFHEEFAQHHDGDPMKIKAAFDAMSPEHLGATKAWHAEQLAGKMKKSVDRLQGLLQELKKQL